MANDAEFAGPLIRQFSKQIAGHAVEKGSSKPGMMKHADGSLLKPILPPPRGPRELNFYVEAFEENAEKDAVLTALKPLLPQFRGVFNVDAENKEFLKLEDLTENFNHPCILDIKMGARTYDPEASEQKIRREQRKYRHTKAFGFCIPGMRVFHLPSQQYVCKGKEYGKGLTVETIKDAFRLYLNGEAGLDRSIVRSFLLRLQSVQRWFSLQTRFAFYASSLLLIYDADSLTTGQAVSSDGEAAGGGEPVEASRPDPSSDSAETPEDGQLSCLRLTDVRMIDFAHVFRSTERDENYLEGLGSLVAILRELLGEEMERDDR